MAIVDQHKNIKERIKQFEELLTKPYYSKDKIWRFYLTRNLFKQRELDLRYDPSKDDTYNFGPYQSIRIDRLHDFNNFDNYWIRINIGLKSHRNTYLSLIIK
jgi:hypothetical protein